MNENDLRKYADLAVRVGVNLQPGQPLVIGYWSNPVLPELESFARLVVDAGYAAGASFVYVDCGDEWSEREAVRQGDLAIYRRLQDWRAQWVEQMAAAGAAFLRIPAGDPNLFSGVDPRRVSAAQKERNAAFDAFNFRRTSGEYSWSIVAAPTQGWADAVHPELPEAERVEALWQDILYCSRATGADPVADWHAHLQTLRARAQWLTDLRIRELHYEAPGTDLVIELPEGHFFGGGGSDTERGVEHVANIPTEEVFTLPLRTGVRGAVASTLPLNLGGSLVEGIRLRFEGGRIVEFSAARGEEALRGLIETDEGSHYLGEVALVPVDSPISQRGVVFYHTLFDENASCHLAIGKAYPMVEGGRTLPRGEWVSNGINDSIVHTDFMVGSAKLDITGTTKSGQTVPIFRAGHWAEPLTGA